MEYELYHDESLEGGYWHGMLLVPVNKKQELQDWLVLARNQTKYYEKIGIKNVRHTRGQIYSCASLWTQIGLIGLRSRSNGINEYICVNNNQYQPVDLLGLKFILFREKNAHKELTGYKDHASKVETTFRFGLKGGLHFLGSDEEPISIKKIHFDGHEHHHRHIDKSRIRDRIYGLRNYCEIADVPDLIDDRRSNHNENNSQNYEDCQFLQLTDLLIGCFRTSLGYAKKESHRRLAYSVKKMLVDEYSKGYARMRNSRWANSFTLSQCYLENGSWIFEGIERNIDESAQQPKLL